ncbi:MAG: hypothetical protein AAFX06_15355 [Planctomycetota bacterium]
MKSKIKVNFILENEGVRFEGKYQLQKFESTEIPLPFDSGDRSVVVEEHQHYTFSTGGGVIQSSIGLSFSATDVCILEPLKAGAVDFEKTRMKSGEIDLVFRVQRFTLDLGDYKGSYKTNVAKEPGNWIKNHAHPAHYAAICDLAFYVSNGSALGYDAVWGKVNVDGSAEPMPDFECGLAKTPDKPSELHLRTVSMLVYANGTTFTVSGFPDDEFDSNQDFKMIRGTSLQVTAKNSSPSAVD